MGEGSYAWAVTYRRSRSWPVLAAAAALVILRGGWACLCRYVGDIVGDLGM